MTQLQKAFLSELKSKEQLTVIDYAVLYGKYCELAIEEELNNGASEPRAKTMGNYYTVSTLSDFINNENKLARIIAIHESDVL